MRGGGGVLRPDAAPVSPVLAPEAPEAPEAACGMVCRQLVRVSSPDAAELMTLLGNTFNIAMVNAAPMARSSKYLPRTGLSRASS
jgi:hypothetical protein